MRRLAALPLFVVLLAAGACTHTPPPARGDRGYLRIGWMPSWNAARAEAARLDRPLLVVLAAGQLDGLC
jgi:hypothetical protein